MYMMGKKGGVVSECRLIWNQGGSWILIKEYKVHWDDRK